MIGLTVVVNKLHSFEKGEKRFRKEVAWHRRFFIRQSDSARAKRAC